MLLLYIIPMVFVCCRVASLEPEVFEAIMLVKVILLYNVVVGCVFLRCLFEVFCCLRLCGMQIEVVCFLLKKLGRDVREGKRRQFNLIGMPIEITRTTFA